MADFTLAQQILNKKSDINKQTVKMQTEKEKLTALKAELKALMAQKVKKAKK